MTLQIVLILLYSVIFTYYTQSHTISGMIYTQLLESMYGVFLLNFIHNLHTVLHNLIQFKFYEGKTFVQSLQNFKIKLEFYTKLQKKISCGLHKNGDIVRMRPFGHACDILIAFRDALFMDEMEAYLLAETWCTYVTCTLVLRSLQGCDAVPQIGWRDSQ